jgi:hypothetical protein
VSANSAPDGCSPVTGFKNGSAEHLFVSVRSNGAAPGGGGCASPVNGCVYTYDVAPQFVTAFDTTSLSSTIGSAIPRYINVSEPALLDLTEVNVDTIVIPAKAGTYSGMTITQSAPSPAGITSRIPCGNFSITQSSLAQSPPAIRTCSDTAHAVVIEEGEQIDVQVVRTGATDLTATFRVQLTADVNPPWNSAKSTSAAINATGGTGGIIIDNTVSGGGSQVYYSTRTSPGNAVQASQAGLN